eukprot:TRINITY_DN15858_c0_g2_i1.p2 TRINITY_DN15858_c0_g2~~TRINITY_DN15858_c0_g2_i1.p2  ORF type:complete len:432 (+),score=65.22 TRINITY_DN15858_c0_g2_i1:83-1297(+)
MVAATPPTGRASRSARIAAAVPRRGRAQIATPLPRTPRRPAPSAVAVALTPAPAPGLPRRAATCGPRRPNRGCGAQPRSGPMPPACRPPSGHVSLLAALGRRPELYGALRKAGIPGVYGHVGDLATIEPSLGAVLGPAGDSLTALVATDAAAGATALRYIREAGLGRTEVLVLDVLSAEGGLGVLQEGETDEGTALTLVRPSDPVFTPALRWALRGVRAPGYESPTGCGTAEHSQATESPARRRPARRSMGGTDSPRSSVARRLSLAFDDGDVIMSPPRGTMCLDFTPSPETPPLDLYLSPMRCAPCTPPPPCCGYASPPPAGCVPGPAALGPPQPPAAGAAGERPRLPSECHAAPQHLRYAAPQRQLQQLQPERRARSARGPRPSWVYTFCSSPGGRRVPCWI